jgi:hypothetical protein
MVLRISVNGIGLMAIRQLLGRVDLSIRFASRIRRLIFRGITPVGV